MVVNTPEIIAVLIEDEESKYCYIEYNDNSFIDLSAAKEVSRVRRMFESQGVRKFVVVIGKSVIFTKEANEYYSTKENMKNIHYIAVYPKSVPFLLIKVLDFIYRIKSSSCSRYFDSVEKCKEWIVKQ